MVVAVVAVDVMEAAVHEVVEVVTVGHLLVAAALVPARAGHRRTRRRVGRAERDDVFVVVSVVRGVQVAVVQVIDVPVVAHPGVPAVGAVDVGHQ